VLRAPPLVFLLLSLLSLSIGCATAPALAPAGMPHDANLRRDSLSELGQRLFAALRAGSISQCVAPSSELDQLVVPEARLHVERERRAHGSFATSSVFPRDWAAASYAGFCAQGAREEPARAALGLAQPGWVLERILVVASLGTTRSASWLTGRFVYTEAGWKLLSLSQIEQPRRQHSDLDLAPCDVEAGLR
jgi:hypothetical protein